MSYCGACGGFYSPDCPRRVDAVCMPAPNPHERHNVVVLVALGVANARVAGMIADNAYCAANGAPPQWDSRHLQAPFDEVAALLAKAAADAA